MSLVSINDVLKITIRVEKIHPYKVVGDRDSYSPYNEGWSDCVSLIESYLEKLPSAETERRWIPVTEALPKKENKSYWICTDTKYQCECRWTNNIYGICKSNNWGWSIFDIPQYTRVIAWMPLPEPYRGDQ